MCVNIVCYDVEASSKSRLRWSRAIEVSLGFRPRGREGHPAETLLVSGSQPYWAFRRFRFLARGFRGEKLVESFPTVDFWKIIETGLNRFSDWEFNLLCEIVVLENISRWYILQGKGMQNQWSQIFNISFFFFVLYIISLKIFFTTWLL